MHNPSLNFVYYITRYAVNGNKKGAGNGNFRILVRCGEWLGEHKKIAFGNNSGAIFSGWKIILYL
jgi:hypothetical protein